MPDPFERLTPRAQRVLTLAGEEAESLRHAEIGVEHLLIGLLREGPGLAARALRELQVDVEGLRQRVRGTLRRGEVGSGGQLALSQGVRDAIRMARVEAERLHHEHLGTEHLLLGILRGGEGAAYLALASAGVTLDRARRQVMAILNAAPPDPSLVSRAPTRLGARAVRTPLGRPSVSIREPTLDEVARCRRCDAPRRAEWRFCAFCGERWPRCETCDAPVPTVAGARFCTECGGGIGDNAPPAF